MSENHKMTKKDRIAIVLSSPFLIFSLLILGNGGRNMVNEFLIVFSPLVVYWGYRFIKGDISFLK